MTLLLRWSLPPSTRLRIKLGCYAVAPVVSAGLLLAVLFHPAFAKSRKSDESGIHKIKHVIVIMQENRSFDSYFGTYPGAEGFPTDWPTVIAKRRITEGSRTGPDRREDRRSGTTQNKEKPRTEMTHI